MFWRCLVAVCSLVFILSGSACIRPHKIPISQGNLLRDKDIERLEIGMTREQVVFLIGQPILSQPFEKSRWDYVLMSRRGYSEPVRKNLTLYFDDDKLVRIENHYPGTGAAETEDSPDTDAADAEE